MRFPAFLKKGSTIGMISPSFGVSGSPYEERYENAIKKFKVLGYRIVECDHLRGIEKCVSAPDAIRAKEFEEMYLDSNIDFLFSVAGGELMMGMLPYIDFEKLRYAKPKYVMGYSDNTNLVFTLPLLTDTAAIYGPHIGSFGMAKWDKSLQESYEVITGQRTQLTSYDKYEIEDLGKTPGNELASYNMTEPVVIESLDKQDVTFSGRLIGGCLDILQVLVGTKFSDVNAFLEKYKEDGFIWFLECCDLTVLSQSRALWQIKQAGWFKYCKGIIYGRPINGEEVFGYTMLDALESQLSELNVPVIYGCDVGHVPPSWTMIAGAYATVEKKGNMATISWQYK